MKKMRKGFTLVELLVVVTILATLTGAMTVSVMGSTARAKAATIASNVDSFVKAAAMYCNNADADVSTATTATVLSAYIGKWADLADKDSVQYTADDITQLTENSKWTRDKTWCVKVVITDKDKANIIAELEKIPGFGKYGGEATVVANGTFWVQLWDGKVVAAKPADES